MSDVINPDVIRQGHIPESVQQTPGVLIFAHFSIVLCFDQLINKRGTNVAFAVLCFQMIYKSRTFEPCLGLEGNA